MAFPILANCLIVSVVNAANYHLSMRGASEDFFKNSRFYSLIFAVGALVAGVLIKRNSVPLAIGVGSYTLFRAIGTQVSPWLVENMGHPAAAPFRHDQLPVILTAAILCRTFLRNR